MRNEPFIKKNSLIKIFFKNGASVEGVVVFWNDRKALLRSTEADNKMIIYNPAENVLMIKLIAGEIISEENPPVLHQNNAFESQENPSVKKHSTKSKNINSRAIQVANERISQISQDRKKAKEILIRSPNPSTMETTYYGTPDFSKYRSIVDSRTKKT